MPFAGTKSFSFFLNGCKQQLFNCKQFFLNISLVTVHGKYDIIKCFKMLHVSREIYFSIMSPFHPQHVHCQEALTDSLK